MTTVEDYSGEVKPKPKHESIERKKRRKSVPYGSRRFVVWDGEADTREGRSNYVLFGNSDGWELSGSSLRSIDCLRFISSTGLVDSQVIHVSFAFKFDVNMLVQDFPKSKVQQLKTEGACWVEEFRLEFLPSKWFRIWDSVRHINIVIYDIFTYFMSSAVKAWKEYLGNDPRVEQVSKGKDRRDSFVYEELETLIRPYFRLELELYVCLVERLREYLATADIYPKQWYGPGTIAGQLLRTRTKNLIRRDLPEEVLEASQYAYFGGRFEQFKTGSYKGPVYSYDIRSAYPHALRLLPDLHTGEWVHSLGEPETLVDFALYRISFDYDKSGAPFHGRSHIPMPFPFRDTKTQIHYPNKVSGWYWGCEVRAAKEWFRFDISESYVFETSDDSRPFAFLEEMYQTRRQWKSDGNQAQLALKLGLNSIYGKLAQRVGWDEERNEPPRWHQLEYAGFATAYCRSMVYRAIMQNPMSIIAVETDGLFSLEPLNLPLGSELGKWEAEYYDGIVYVQSGVYWLSRWKPHRGFEWYKARIRGFGTGELDIRDALNRAPTLTPITGKTHRFAGFNGYLYRDSWLTWIDTEHVAIWGGNGKRAHARKLCNKCQGGNDKLHDLIIMRPWGGESHPHHLFWKPNTGVYSEYAEHGLSSDISGVQARAELLSE